MDPLTEWKFSALQAEYADKGQRLDFFREIGIQSRELENDCWVIRREAFKMLADMRDHGWSDVILAPKAAYFGWSIAQVDSDVLRELFLGKDAGNPADPNPVEAEHVYVQLARNFPPEAIEWVKRAHWTGPVNVPWDRIDQDDKDKWAASHQPEKVKEFEGMIKAHDNHVAPSVLVQEPGSQKAFIVDGHHRALAHENLKQDVLSYLGNINPEDRKAALETHTHQIHQGADPQNKADLPKG